MSVDLTKRGFGHSDTFYPYNSLKRTAKFEVYGLLVYLCQTALIL